MASIAHIASMCQSSVLNIQSKMELTNFEFRVLLNHYSKQNYKAATAASRISEVEGACDTTMVPNLNTGEANTEDLPCSGRPKLWDIDNIRRVLEQNPQKVLVGCHKNLVHQKIT